MKNLLTSLLVLFLFVGGASAQDKPGTFETGKGTFLLNGKPFVVKAAEVHYPRIPKEYWEQRIQMCKSLGMNTLCLYVFWNIHEQEPGKFDFTGNNDIAAFCKLAQKNGMYVIVRPGPYVCAEWEMGGLPWWLLKKKGIKLRESDPYFIERVRLFENAVGKELASLTIKNGGPIIMVQVENEYGSYGTNKTYVSQVRDIVREAGFKDVTLFQCDWSSNFTLNGLDDLVWTMNFGTGANIDAQFKKLKEMRPDSPLMCSEFWSGWFDKWGEAHETRKAEDMVAGLREMLEKNISFSLYMTHGGTSWGHWVGADSPGYSPRCSSYDYDAPINEAGQATPKFWKLREMMANFNEGRQLPAVPREYPVITINDIKFTQVAPLFTNLPPSIKSHDIQSMEAFNQGYGSILYRTVLPATTAKSVLKVTEAHDYAQVFVDGKLIGTLDRRRGERELALPIVPKDAVLDILVENMGRINYGRTINDYKGITEKVELAVDLDGHASILDLKDWEVFCLPDSYEFAVGKHYGMIPEIPVAGYYKGSFNLKKIGDTFLDLSTWGKGQVYVNGYAIGRFWKIGPQRTLYMPGCWLKKGENEIVVLDLVKPDKISVSGLAQPILDGLNNPTVATHRNGKEKLDLTGLVPVHQGEFAHKNGWQEVKFVRPVSGKYLCLEAVDGFQGNIAAIAELDVLGADSKPISREKWMVDYADSEETHVGNHTADKVYDHQESTYWQTVAQDAFPHQIVLNLGSEIEISGLRYLPRAEAGVPDAVRHYRVYVMNSVKK